MVELSGKSVETANTMQVHDHESLEHLGDLTGGSAVAAAPLGAVACQKPGF